MKRDMRCLAMTCGDVPHAMMSDDHTFLNKGEKVMTPKEQRLAKSIGRAVSSKRAKKGLTQGQVAEEIGVEPETISRIERGVTLAPLSRLAEIADVLKCPLADLLRDGSPRLTDRLQSFGAQLQGLSESDAKLVSDMIETLATRLKKRG